MRLYSNVRDTKSLFRNNCDQKYGVPDANAAKFMKFTSSLIR